MNLNSSQSPPASPPSIAVIANCLTPYRVHLHGLIAAGIPEIQLHTFVTHGDADFKWALEVPASINVTNFAGKGDSPLSGIYANPLREWRKGGLLIKSLQKINVKAVICNSYRYLSYLRVIQHCHREGIPLFVNNDSNIRSEPRLMPWTAWAKRRVYSWWLARVTGVMPMGSLGDEFFLKYGADPHRFYRVPYTPDYKAFEERDLRGLDRFRQSFGLRGDKKYILFSGRLAHVKRVDLLIDAFTHLAPARAEWNLLIVGDGPLGDQLRRRVPDALQKRVIWTGFLEQEELNLAYHAADVLVLPSDHEPWAVVVQEAMAAGLVVVASDVVGAAHELIVDQQSGRFFPRGNVEALRQVILDVTASERLEQFKRSSHSALQAWRKRIDPVAEIRRALRFTGTLLE
jgi:glycosyltransferase involved in cell wall biosynthesis